MTLPRELTADRPPEAGQSTTSWTGQRDANGWPVVGRTDRLTTPLPGFPVNPVSDRANRPPVNAPVSPAVDRLTGAAPVAPTGTPLTGPSTTGQAPTGQSHASANGTANRAVTLSATARRLTADKGPLWLLGVFYAVMAAISLYGQTQGIIAWFHLQPFTVLGVTVPARVPALIPAGALELLATVLLAFADWRQRTRREKARVVRLFAAAAALGVAFLNWQGHQGHDELGPRILFVGASVFAFLVVAVHIAARFRDAHPEWTKGRAPDYGALQWLTQPRLTLRARRIALAVADEEARPGRAESLATAQVAMEREAKLGRIREAIRAKIAAGTDPLTAELAIASMDLEGIARQLAASADNMGMAALLGGDLTPARLTAKIDPAGVAKDERDKSDTPPIVRSEVTPRPVRKPRAAKPAKRKPASTPVSTPPAPSADAPTEAVDLATPSEAPAPTGPAQPSPTNVFELSDLTPKVRHGIEAVRAWQHEEQTREIPSQNEIVEIAKIAKGTAKIVQERLLALDAEKSA
jgi:hypothetical protein